MNQIKILTAHIDVTKAFDLGYKLLDIRIIFLYCTKHKLSVHIDVNQIHLFISGKSHLDLPDACLIVSLFLFEVGINYLQNSQNRNAKKS